MASAANRRQVAPRERRRRDPELDAHRELEVRACPAGERSPRARPGWTSVFTFSLLPFSFYSCDDAGGEFRDTLCRRIGESPVLKRFEWMCKCVQLVEERLVR